MRSTAWMALSALVALPLGALPVGAAPSGADLARAANSGASSPIVDVGRRGGHGHGHGHGGHHHGHGHAGHWHGGHGHHGHFRPRWYGVPAWSYGAYYADPYYYADDDDDYVDNDDGEAVVYSDEGDAIARCASRYRSFDARTGTYLNNDGNRYVCPYLR